MVRRELVINDDYYTHLFTVACMDTGYTVARYVNKNRYVPQRPWATTVQTVIRLQANLGVFLLQLGKKAHDVPPFLVAVVTGKMAVVFGITLDDPRAECHLRQCNPYAGSMLKSDFCSAA